MELSGYRIAKTSEDSDIGGCSFCSYFDAHGISRLMVEDEVTDGEPDSFFNSVGPHALSKRIAMDGKIFYSIIPLKGGQAEPRLISQLVPCMSPKIIRKPNAPFFKSTSTYKLSLTSTYKLSLTLDHYIGFV